MAHIVRRGESFCVVYYYTDKDGKRHQKWETFHQEAEAERRKAEVEIGKKKSTLIVPSKITVSEGLIVIRYYLALRGAENGVTAMVTPFFCVQG